MIDVDTLLSAIDDDSGRCIVPLVLRHRVQQLSRVRAGGARRDFALLTQLRWLSQQRVLAAIERTSYASDPLPVRAQRFAFCLLALTIARAIRCDSLFSVARVQTSSARPLRLPPSPP